MKKQAHYKPKLILGASCMMLIASADTGYAQQTDTGAEADVSQETATADEAAGAGILPIPD